MIFNSMNPKPNLLGVELPFPHVRLVDWDTGFRESLKVQSDFEKLLARTRGFLAVVGLNECQYQERLQKAGIAFTARPIDRIYCGERFDSPTEIIYDKDGSTRYGYQFLFSSIDSFGGEILVFKRPVPDEEIADVYEAWRAADRASSDAYMRRRQQRERDISRPFWTMINAGWNCAVIAIALRLLGRCVADELLAGWGAAALDRDGFLRSLEAYGQLCPADIWEFVQTIPREEED